jgi:hypothetical protein
VRSRDAFIDTTTPVPAKATSFYAWIGSGLNRLIYVAGGAAVRLLNRETAADASQFSATCRGFTVCEAGNKAIVATYNTAGAGATEVRVLLPLVSTGVVDKAFPAPHNTPLVMSDIGAGECTEGTKLFAYIIETRSGFTGQPSSRTAGTFSPTSYTVAADGRKVRGTLTATLPADVAYVHGITTRTDNPNKWYFEPGATVSVTGGTPTVTAIDFNTSDDTLEATATEVVDNFDFLVQNGSGNGPITPHCVIQYGKRAVYLTPYRAYASEPGDYQAITEALHGFELPGGRQMVTGFPFRQSLYLLGPGWTYEVADNLDHPVTWTNPTEISGAIGTTAIKGVAWKTAGDYVWVAGESGLYLFNGSYSRLPISYMNGDWWRRINWLAPQSVEVVDDYIRQRVMVCAPIDGASEMTHVLVWDYARGLEPNSVDFSYYDFATAFSALGLIKNAVTGEMDVWLGPTTAGFIRTEEAGTACETTSEYETGFVLTKAPRKWSIFGGADFDVSGSGTMDVTAYGVDRTVSAALTAITLSDTPGEAPQERFHLQSENMSLKVTCGPGERFDLSSLTIYFKRWIGNR